MVVNDNDGARVLDYRWIVHLSRMYDGTIHETDRNDVYLYDLMGAIKRNS